MKLEGKKVTVVGLGRSGFAAAKFLADRKAHVSATDGSEKKEVLENAGYLRSLGVAAETGRHTEGFVLGSDLVVTSPGVPRESLPLATARAKGIPVISEIELAANFCPGRIAAITGSNGKTTTSHLLHRMLADAGKKSVLCGNVGFSFLSALGDVDAKTVVVLELSSFQLEDSPTLRPDAAAVLNVSPNHLDRHKTFENYVRAKKRIFANQRGADLLVLNHDDRVVCRMARRVAPKVVYFSKLPLKEGVFVKAGYVVVSEKGKERPLFRRDRSPLEGEHNLENLMAASALALRYGATPESLDKTAGSFRTLEHRIEPLGEVRGVRFVNDSKSTTIDSTRAAIEAVQGSVVLVAGGRDKGVSFEAIETLLEKKVKTAVLYGEARQKMAASWRRFRKVRQEHVFADAVRAAFEAAAPGDTLLLSPMCTSFDQFSSFEQRGEAFKKVFRELAGG